MKWHVCEYQEKLWLSCCIAQQTQYDAFQRLFVLGLSGWDTTLSWMQRMQQKLGK
jgi:hypothetical protein